MTNQKPVVRKPVILKPDFKKKNFVARELWTLLGLLGLAACSNGGGVTQQQASTAAPSPTPVVSALNLLATNDLVSESKSNLISVARKETSLDYSVQYKFNSGAFNSIRLLTNDLTGKSADCDDLTPSVATLDGPDFTAARMNVDTTVTVTPGADYTLTLSSAQDCKIKDFEVNVQVWGGLAGETTPDVYVARECTLDGAGTIDFFSLDDYIKGFIQGSSTPFVGEGIDQTQHYCGEAFTANYSCEISYDGNAITCGSKKAISSSVATGASDPTAETEKSFTLGLDVGLNDSSADETSGTLSCRNTHDHAVHVLTHCQNRVRDLSTFQATAN